MSLEFEYGTWSWRCVSQRLRLEMADPRKVVGIKSGRLKCRQTLPVKIIDQAKLNGHRNQASTDGNFGLDGVGRRLRRTVGEGPTKNNKKYKDRILDRVQVRPDLYLEVKRLSNPFFFDSRRSIEIDFMPIKQYFLFYLFAIKKIR